MQTHWWAPLPSCCCRFWCVDFCVTDSFCGKGYMHGARDGCLKKLSRQWCSVNRQIVVGTGRGWLEDGWRKNGIIIFGLVVMRSEGYIGSGGKVFEGDNWVGVSVNNIDFIARLGRRRGQWPILVKCISLAVHLQVLRKTKINRLERLELMMSGNKQNWD